MLGFLRTYAVILISILAVGLLAFSSFQLLSIKNEIHDMNSSLSDINSSLGDIKYVLDVPNKNGYGAFYSQKRNKYLAPENTIGETIESIESQLSDIYEIIKK
jgi:hypothetical protein